MPDSQTQPPYILSIDAGTEAIKAGLFDLRGRRVALGVRSYRTYFPQPAWAEQDPEEWWNGLVGAVHDCLLAAGVRGEEIIAVAADATTCTLVPMSADGRALRRAFLWMDVRAGEQARSVFASGDVALRYCLAGANAEWMPPKMLWFKQNERALYERMDYLLEFTDWIAYRLTGRFTLNIDTISQRWFYHTPSGGWPHSLFHALDLDDLVAKFPQSIHRVGEIVGELLPVVAAELGLPAGLPVAACGGDAFIGLLGQGVSAPGDVGVIMGSSNVLSALAHEELHFPGILGSFPDAIVPGLNLVEAGQVSTGSILSWFKRNFGHGAAADAAMQGLSVYQLLDREAGQAPVGSGGLMVLDYFQGNRTPHTDSAARGMIWGLSLQADRGHIFRALMEGVAYGLQDIVLTLERHNFDLGRIIASGGATQSPLFMQIYADVLGKTIAVTREAEASLLGSAVAAAVGAGAYPDLHTASQAMVQVSHEYGPDMARHAEYQFFVNMQQETYRQMKGLMHNMSLKQQRN